MLYNILLYIKVVMLTCIFTYFCYLCLSYAIYFIKCNINTWNVIVKWINEISLQNFILTKHNNNIYITKYIKCNLYILKSIKKFCHTNTRKTVTKFYFIKEFKFSMLLCGVLERDFWKLGLEEDCPNVVESIDLVLVWSFIVVKRHNDNNNS